MIKSMTAFSGNETIYIWGHASWEIRSLNQRYLDIYMDLPKNLFELSTIIRKKIKNQLSRGKIECSLKININQEKNNELFINKNLISTLILHARWIKKEIKEGEIDPIQLLYYPGVLLQKTNNNSHINNDLLISFEKTLERLIKNREKEGTCLKEKIIDKLHCISQKINDIQKHIPNSIQQKRTKLLNQIKNTCLNFDETRLEQELFIVIQKIDISEEIDRIIIHIQEIHHLLSKKSPIGKQLGFIAQELQREINTLTAKSIDINIINLAISIKVFIEQIREQIQNIE